jgi:hypothetical protein
VHHYIPKPHPKKKKLDVDLYLARISHISQAGLLILAVVGYVYTVKPLYEKALLDEQIAQKELELKETKKALEANYKQLRTDTVKSFVFFTGAECSGILKRPRRPIKLGEKGPDSMEIHSEVFKIDVAQCLLEEFKNSKQLKSLRKADYLFLEENVKELGVRLESLRAKSFDELKRFSDEAIKDPSKLKPINPDSFTATSLEFRRSFMTPEDYRVEVVLAQINQGLSDISHKYSKTLGDQIRELTKITWPESAPLP